MKKKKSPADRSVQYQRYFCKKCEVSLGNPLSKNLCKPPKEFRPVHKFLKKQSNNNKKIIF